MDSTPPSGKMSGNGSDKSSRSQAQQQASAGSNGDARAKLMNDMKAVIGEAESWLESSASAAGDGAEPGAAQQQFQETLQTAKTDLLRLESDLLAKTKLMAQATDAYVQDNPWKAVTMGAAIGMLFGLFISRK